MFLNLHTSIRDARTVQLKPKKYSEKILKASLIFLPLLLISLVDNNNPQLFQTHSFVELPNQLSPPYHPAKNRHLGSQKILSSFQPLPSSRRLPSIPTENFPSLPKRPKSLNRIIKPKKIFSKIPKTLSRRLVLACFVMKFACSNRHQPMKVIATH